MQNKIYLSIRNKDNIKIDNKINFPKYIKREESMRAYTLLNLMFNLLNIKFDIEKIKYTENGKPYIENSYIKFNYSHSHNFIACVISSSDVGIDIEDEFEISEEARKLYLKKINFYARKDWVMKEAYCKLLGNFNDEIFKKIDTKKINKNKYEIEKENYDCVIFYEGLKKELVIL